MDLPNSTSGNVPVFKSGILREKIRDRCCNFLIAKRKEEYLSYGQKLKQRWVGDSGHRQVTLNKTEVLKEYILNQTLLIEIELKRKRMDMFLVGYGE